MASTLDHDLARHLHHRSIANGRPSPLHAEAHDLAQDVLTWLEDRAVLVEPQESGRADLDQAQLVIPGPNAVVDVYCRPFPVEGVTAWVHDDADLDRLLVLPDVPSTRLDRARSLGPIVRRLAGWVWAAR